VQLVEILGNHDAFCIRPRASADSTARVSRLVAVVGIPFRAQLGAPGLVPVTHRARQILASPIGSSQPTQVGGLAPGATDKKAHGRAELDAFSADALLPITADDTERRHRRQKKEMLFHKLLLFLRN
jgi:hypothetical protein